MNRVGLLAIFVGLLIQVSGKATVREKRATACYSDLGCFSTGSPFFDIPNRPVNLLPQRPEIINTKFQLFTRSTKNHGQFIHANDFNSIRNSPLSASRPTKIACHGFLENGGVDWLHDMKDAFLVAGDYNVIIVGWGGGSGLPYTQATANTRVVGAEIAKLITTLQTQKGVRPQDVHVIGHSLGAHIAGYAGERIVSLGRITGLDPAEPYYQYTDKVVRLDHTDALFVDVIHTDSESILKLGFGMVEACGHIDFYPNRGEDQPGCDKGVVDNIRLEGDLYNGGKEYIACNHLRSYKYFTESITSSCPWVGYHCDSYDNFLRGKCMSCSGGSCAKLGFHANEVRLRSGQFNVKYFLETGSNAPFCRYHYMFHITFGNPSGASSWDGKLYGNIHGANGQLGEIPLSSSAMSIQPGKSYGFVVTSTHDIGHITDASVHFEHASSILNPFQWNPFNLRHPTIYVASIEVINGETNDKVKFCGSSKNGIETHSSMTYSTVC